MRAAIPTTAEAVEASIVLARRLGVVGHAAQVIADGYSLRVRVGPVVTRVVTAGLLLRGDPLPWLQREVAVAGWLASRQADILSPWPDAGPHEVDGLWISVWPFAEANANAAASAADEDAQTGGAEFGRRIAALHGILRSCPVELPVLAGPQTDIAAAMRHSGHPLLHRAAQRLLPLIAQWPVQPLHGDAHTGNLLRTAGGLRWIDFEDVCAGPAEWDLASATLRPEAAAAYPGVLDEKRLADCRDLRRLQTLASLLLSEGPTAPELEPLERVLAMRY